MRALLLVLGLAALEVPGVVDRVEGSWALVEWPDRSCRDLPLALFEGSPQEGQIVVLRAWSHPQGPWRLDAGGLRLGLGTPPLDFKLPAPPGARIGQRFLVTLDASIPADSARQDRVHVRRGRDDHPSPNLTRRRRP